ncbi:uncharacterized protein [Euwallacea fornicatus]|uniref:uncharacterized protein n=1 Tax=Euwallacea fornicatus TaxID=995702 RepID=UPI00338E9BC6
MNFSPFGSHLSTSIPNIHQFAVKLSQDFPSTSLNSLDDITLTNRYTANGVPSFTQHHHATAQQQLLAASNKSNGNYLNSQSLYSQNASSKRQNFDQQNLDVFCLRSDKLLVGNGENSKKKEHELSKSLGQVQSNNQAISSNPSSSVLSNSWQNLTASMDYLAQLPANSLPITLQDILKYSAESLKKDSSVSQQSTLLQQSSSPNLNLMNNGTINIDSLNIGSNTNGNLSTNSNTLSTINTDHLNNSTTIVIKKKKKKRPEKEKKPKPKPGEIRLSTALDGSTLYCCPECHMALPERDLLEQHLMGHNMERRFVCDICGAALKRKDHLTRHKQSHNPERPFVCSVCLKAFKRKEQLTLHFVIHSGEKRHVCNECGKGFYRKDHLRKHTRSHIARRVKAELSQQGISSHSITP